MNKKAKAMLIGLLAIVTATGAAFGIAAQKRGASDEKTTHRSSVQTQNKQTENEANEANEADETAETNATEQNENAESANLQSSAKITPEQAKSAALAQISGTVKNVQLENEEGNVVYAVEIQIADGGIREVIVDANSGKVLPAENDSENDGEND